MDRVAAFKSEAEPSENPGAVAEGYMKDFNEAMENDLGAPQALSILWKLVKDSSVSEADKLAVLYHMDRILGLGLPEAEKKTETVGTEEDLKLLQERAEAKKNKDYKRADEIRDELKKRGFNVKDTPSGAILERIV